MGTRASDIRYRVVFDEMKKHFPGLWDGETEVNGADLVAWLTGQIFGLDL